MIFSIGHSTHDIDAFVAAAQTMDKIIDVRSHPTSRWEQFRFENLRIWLPEHDIGYEWWPGLGGWTAAHYEEYHESMAEVGVDLAVYSKGAFPKQRIGKDRTADTDAPAWINQGLYDYAWYMTTPNFLESADLLAKTHGTGEERVAIMCAEALWWKCHRSMIADYLHWRDVFCGHLPPRPPVRPTTRKYKPHSEAIGNRLERYPAAVRRAWEEW